jgi:cobyrinic acid a,c-diamide synthase
MIVTRHVVADKIAEYLHRRITLDQLVDWAENALLDSEFEENDAQTISAVVGRLGVADVRAFGLTWDDCEDLLGRLGFSARIEITTN